MVEASSELGQRYGLLSQDTAEHTLVRLLELRLVGRVHQGEGVGGGVELGLHSG